MSLHNKLDTDKIMQLNDALMGCEVTGSPLIVERVGRDPSNAVTVVYSVGSDLPWAVTTPGSTQSAFNITGVLVLLARLQINPSTVPCFCTAPVIGCGTCEQNATLCLS